MCCLGYYYLFWYIFLSHSKSARPFSRCIPLWVRPTDRAWIPRWRHQRVRLIRPCLRQDEGGNNTVMYTRWISIIEIRAHFSLPHFPTPLWKEIKPTQQAKRAKSSDILLAMWVRNDLVSQSVIFRDLDTATNLTCVSPWLLAIFEISPWPLPDLS